MPRKKNPNNNYFNQEVEDAVCAYLHSDNQSEREKHFRIIYPALCKIAEVWYHKVKFSQSDDDMEDVMANCVAWLVEKMPMFKCGMGTKAFSYYTVTAKFYYMQLSNKNYSYFKKNVPLSSMTYNWDVENSDRDDERKRDAARLLNRFIAYCNHNFEMMFPVKLRPYARAVLNTASNFEEIDDYRNRKILQLIYKNGNIAERQKTFVNKAINIMVAHLTLFKERFYDGDESLDMCIKNHLTEDEKRIVRENVIVGRKNNGTVAFARKFGVDVSVVTEYLKSTQAIL